MMEIKRGDIFWVNFSKQKCSNEICKERPAIVVSNNTGNRFSSMVSVVPTTTQKKKLLPIHIEISGYGLPQPSIVLAEQLVSIDKTALGRKIGSLAGTDDLRKIDRCLRIQLGVA